MPTIFGTMMQALVFIVIFRQRALFIPLSMPIPLTILLGQVDILMTVPFVLLRSGVAGGIALAFMTQSLNS